MEVINPNILIDYYTPVDPPFYSVNFPSGFGSGAADVKVQGTTGYVATAGGLEVYNVSNPTSPSLLGSVSSTAYGYMQVVGGMAYVASGGSGLKIYDVSNSSSPTSVGSYASANAQDVALDGDYAMIADGADGLRVVDVSTPSAPVLQNPLPHALRLWWREAGGDTFVPFRLLRHADPQRHGPHSPVGERIMACADTTDGNHGRGRLRATTRSSPQRGSSCWMSPILSIRCRKRPPTRANMLYDPARVKVIVVCSSIASAW